MTRAAGDAGAVHGIQDAPVDRLQAVPDVGQGAPGDDAHRVIDVGLLHLVLDADVLDAIAEVGRGVRYV